MQMNLEATIAAHNVWQKKHAALRMMRKIMALHQYIDIGSEVVASEDRHQKRGGHGNGAFQKVIAIRWELHLNSDLPQTNDIYLDGRPMTKLTRKR